MSDKRQKIPIESRDRGEKGRFLPGNSLSKIGAEKAGRPPVIRHIRDLAREQTEPAFAALLDIAMNGKSESARVAALKELFDRGYGKSAQPLVGPDGGALEIHHVHKLSEAQLEIVAAGGTLPPLLE